MVTDGNDFAWAVRSEDGDDVSAWSAPCQFTADLTRPDHEPTLTSSDYPDDGEFHGGPGTPGAFTFGANGVPDVVGYRWTASAGSGFAPADQLGGGATIAYTPRDSGPNDLSVSSVDRAGNSSPARSSHFYVTATEPVVHPSLPRPGTGIPFDVTVQPRQPGVVSYTYSVNGGPETTVAAGPDGTATISVTLPEYGDNSFDIFGTNSSGTRTGIAHERFSTTDAPIMSSTDYPESGTHGGPGVPGTFTITPMLAGTIEYHYFVDFGDDVNVVPAAPDGTASFTYTPTEAGFHIIELIAITATGQSHLSTDYFFEVGQGPTG